MTGGLAAPPATTPADPAKRAPLSVGIDQVNQGEGNVLRVFGEGFRRDGAALFRRLRIRRLGTQVPQRHNTPLADDLLGNLVHGGQHTAKDPPT